MLGVGEEQGCCGGEGGVRCGVGGQVDKPLAGHPFPGAEAGDAFGGGAAPEEGVLLLREGAVRMVVSGRGVEDFVDVVPG